MEFQDIDETPVFNKRETFMLIFEEIYGNNTSMVTLIESYHKAELIFIKRFGAKAYKSDESFARTYYYYLNQKLKKNGQNQKIRDRQRL